MAYIRIYPDPVVKVSHYISPAKIYCNRHPTKVILQYKDIINLKKKEKKRKKRKKQISELSFFFCKYVD